MNKQIVIETIEEYIKLSKNEISEDEIKIKTIAIMKSELELPLLLIALLAEKKLSNSIHQELKDITEHGGRLTGTWLIEIAEAHDTYLK